MSVSPPTSSRALRLMLAAVTTLVALAGCPADVAFEPSDTTDTADTTDAADTVDGDSHVDPDATETSADTVDDVDTTACVPTCDNDLAYGICGDDGCGGACYCTAAQACDEALCACLVGCDSVVDRHVLPVFDGATDTRGQPIVASFRQPFPGQNDLVLRRFDGIVWDPESVETDLTEPRSVALAQVDGAPFLLVDSGATPSTELRWFRREGSTWKARPFDLCWRGAAMKLRATPLGLYASCVDSGSHELVIARLDDPHGAAPVWTEVGRYGGLGVTDFGSVIQVLPYAFTIDATGRPHIAYSCCSPSPIELSYAYRGTIDWHVESFGAAPVVLGSQTRNVAIAIDRADHPHIVYQTANGTRAELVHRSWDGEKWASEPLVTARSDNGSVGEVMSLRVDPKRNFHLIYREDSKLAYRYYDGFGWSEATKAANLISDHDGIALSLDTSDTPHALYVDSADELVWWTPPAPL